MYPIKTGVASDASNTSIAKVSGLATQEGVDLLAEPAKKKDQDAFGTCPSLLAHYDCRGAGEAGREEAPWQSVLRW